MAYFFRRCAARSRPSPPSASSAVVPGSGTGPVASKPQLTSVCVSPPDRSAMSNVQCPFGSSPLNDESNSDGVFVTAPGVCPGGASMSPSATHRLLPRRRRLPHGRDEAGRDAPPDLAGTIQS